MNTTTAPQALEMLNSEMTKELADAWSRKLIGTCHEDLSRLVHETYAEAFARDATEQEVAAAEAFIRQQERTVIHDEAVASATNGSRATGETVDATKAAAVSDFCHALFCSNEFLYLD